MSKPADPPADLKHVEQAGAETAGSAATEQPAAPAEVGGPQGPEPTRYGDWERKGRCIDF